MSFPGLIIVGRGRLGMGWVCFLGCLPFRLSWGFILVFVVRIESSSERALRRIPFSARVRLPAVYVSVFRHGEVTRPLVVVYCVAASESVPFHGELLKQTQNGVGFSRTSRDFEFLVLIGPWALGWA